MTRRLATVATLLLVASCGPNMADQPKMEADETTDVFPEGVVAKMPVAGTVSREDDVGADILAQRPPLDDALLRRGQERFTIFCTPCHGGGAEGDGIIVRRGFPAPPSLHREDLRDAPDSLYLATIADGYGVMFPYGDRVPPPDRWAIVAYIRALQLARRVPLAQLPDELRKRLP